MKQVDVKELHLNFLLKTDYLGKPFNFSEGKFNSTSIYHNIMSFLNHLFFCTIEVRSSYAYLYCKFSLTFLIPYKTVGSSLSTFKIMQYCSFCYLLTV